MNNTLLGISHLLVTARACFKRCALKCKNESKKFARCTLVIMLHAATSATKINGHTSAKMFVQDNEEKA